jgi:hypothetical protein
MDTPFWHNIYVTELGPLKPPAIDCTKVGPSVPDTVVPAPPKTPREIGGPSGPDPTRFGDWERGGRCIDF